MSAHPLTTEYLDHLRLEAQVLPRGVRTELLADIEAHLAEATSAEMPNAEVLTVLDRLGDPDEIVQAHLPDAPPRLAPRRGVQEWSAIFLLLFGGFVFGVGWIAGLILLWSSSAWRTRDKWLGTLVLPGGLALVVIELAWGAQHVNGPCVFAPSRSACTISNSGAESVVVIVLAATVLLPIVTAIYLARRAGRSPAVPV